MQPTEHKHKKDDELIAHIKQSLKTHEEVYRVGAWEKFNERGQTKKRPILWLTRLSGAAAILAICFSLIWYSTNSPKTEQLTQQKVQKGNSSIQDQPAKEGVNTIESSSLANEHLAMNAKDAKRSINNGNSRSAAAREAIFAQPTVEPNTQVKINNVTPTATAIVPPVVSKPLNTEQVIAKVDEKVKTDIIDVLASETQKSEGKIDKLAVNKKSKWEWGLMLAPSFGNTEELNMGYGVSMTYNISNRLSVSSGIAYNKMNASKNLPTKIGSSSILLGNTKSLEMISEEVTGVDIPLELKYTINKNMYANLGVSGFAVLNQNRRNTFVETVVVKNAVGSSGGTGASGASSSIDNEAKGQFANSYMVNKRTTELASGTTIEDLDYIGFYNLSFGYTKKVYKNHALAIEPFVKLPIKGVTQDNLRLVGTGVRLKVGF